MMEWFTYGVATVMAVLLAIALQKFKKSLQRRIREQEIALGK